MNTFGNFDFTPGQMFTFTGLFHRCISQSATAACPWVVKHKGQAKAIAEQVARLFECPAHPSKGLTSCLRKQDAYKLYSAEHAIEVSCHKHAEKVMKLRSDKASNFLVEYSRSGSKN
jgi:carboxylesterase type B